MIDYFYTDTSGFITVRGSTPYEQDITPDAPNELHLQYAPPEYNYYIDGNFYYKEVYEQQKAIVDTQRLQLLQASDWTQLPDSPLTEEQKAAWATYRQELRDIPEQSGYPFNVVYPTPPQ